MHHHPVNSSRIASVAYDEASGILEIRFRDNTTLQYDKVPERIFRNFLQVVSKGRFYDGVIKGKFSERRCS
ncbi:KTSC domain-containing protein [Raoultella sp. BIGb0138]|uniref:KTSC domain-containing protein n=1 Tax=Raoultella sp. BIGb0138 TaxID=2485115 RepID=UPI0010437AB5|nr:KTSC domain-containing protein [Raoultella sp. BIGb0138]TCW07760.1 KTSC domain-containing protein [Raoultella sp. BIGb0138]